MPPKLTSKTSKKDQAYEKIRALICQPGARAYQNLTETALAKQLQISRTPVREALIELQSEGFLSIIPNRGIFIHDPSISEVRSLYDIRIALEQFVLGELCGSLKEEDFKALQEIMDKQARCIPETRTDEFITEDRNFHLYFFKTFGNPLMLEQFLTLRSRLYRVNYRMLQSSDNMTTFHSEHERIVGFLKAGNKLEAISGMGFHLKGAKSRLL
jgi:DNA-binding GntR family transcriptional regulator